MCCMPFIMRCLLFIALLLAAFTTENNVTGSAGLSCVLTSDKHVYKVGELPKFAVEISNSSKDDIYLIGSLDGSDVEWRFPHCYYSIERPKPDTTRLARCRTLNPLRVADFKLVKAGGKFNPYESIDAYSFFGDYTTLNKETFKNPGIYKLKFHYSTNSPNISDFLEEKSLHRDRSDSIKINAFFKKVPKVEITSNEIEIRVEE